MNKTLKTKLKIRCAWCGEDMGEKDGKGIEGTSDGICDNCLLQHFPHLYERIIKEDQDNGNKETIKMATQ